MKKILILCCAVFAIANINAQGRRANLQAIHAQYGYVTDKGDLTGGFMAKAGYSKVFAEKGFLGKAEGFYQSYDVTYYDNQVLPYEKYGLSVMAGYSYEGLAPVYLNAYLGAYAGAEKANKGDQKDPKYGTEIPQKVTGFVYGINGSVEAEVAITRRLSFVADYTQYYDLTSKFSKSNFGLFGGLKFYIN